MRILRILFSTMVILAALSLLSFAQSPPTCSDSDGGLTYDITGTVTGIGPKGNVYTKPDTCIDSTLREFYCSATTPKPKLHPCPSGCESGACLPELSSTWTPASAYPWGTYAYAYSWQAMATYAHPGCILIISSLWQYGPPPPDASAWPTLASTIQSMTVCRVGVLDSALSRALGKATSLLAHSIPYEFVAYGPEALNGVPIDEVTPTNMPAFAAQAASWTQANSKRLVYGPATELLASQWEWGKSYTFDKDLIRALAATLPPDAVWFIRPIQFEMIYGGDMVGFRAAVADLATTIHEGNPSLSIWAQILLQPNASTAFLQKREALLGIADAVYAHIAGPQDISLHEGTLLAMEDIWKATQ